MESSGDINLAEIVRLLNTGLEVVEVWEVEAVLDGLGVQATEVATGTLAAIRFVLKVKGAAVIVGFPRIDPLHYP